MSFLLHTSNKPQHEHCNLHVMQDAVNNGTFLHDMVSATFTLGLLKAWSKRVLWALLRSCRHVLLSSVHRKVNVNKMVRTAQSTWSKIL